MEEATNRAATAETNVVRLSRKYAAMQEEHNELLEKWNTSTATQSKREHEMVARLEELHAWKLEATEKISILLERARNSISLEDHRAVTGELELL